MTRRGVKGQKGANKGNFSIKILLTFIVFTQKALSYPVDMSQWQLLHGGDELKVYSSTQKKQYKLSIQKKEAYSSDWKSAKGDKVYADIIGKKKQMLSLLGIKNWKVNSKIWIPGEELSRLEIKGTYINSRNKKVEFFEVHEFSKGEKTQYLFTQIIP